MEVNNIINQIGNTPLIKLKQVSELTSCNIYGKAEFFNPGESVKDRAALYIVKDAFERKKIEKGGIIVEGTAGNTGIGLAVVCKEFGLDLRRYLFDPVNSSTAYKIKYDIDTLLPSQEPRIQLENVNVDAITDAQEYYIEMQINIPSLDAYGITLKSLLNSNGYYVL